MNANQSATSISGTIATPSGKGRHTENFPVGSFLIRSGLRQHVHTFYRFARMADDIADNSALPADEKIHRLALMRTVLLDPARTDVLVSAAMRDSLEETGVPAIHCVDLLVAFRQDAAKQRYSSWADLKQYCRYSAAPVGRYLLDLHGEKLGAREPSDALCAALQVLNHLQDCKADLREMDRVYVPIDYLNAEGVDVDALSAPQCSPGLRRVLDRLLADTESLVAKAQRLPEQVDDFRLRCESAIIVLIAEKLATELRRRDPLAERVKLSAWSYAACAVKGLLWAFTVALRGRR
jgi:squalene synthase HpnC